VIFQTRQVEKLWVISFAVTLIHASAIADGQADTSGTNSPVAPDSRFGLFNRLDHRSAYNQDFFPQPLLVEDTSVETDGEVEFGSLHTEAGNKQSDVARVEVQKSLGLLTFELGVPYERDSDADDVSRGIGDIDLGARYPLYQFVSDDGFFDSTLGVVMEVGIPLDTAVGNDTEFNPGIFNDLKLGESFSLQSVFGYSTLVGGGGDGGLETFEYGFDLSYTVRHNSLPLPGVVQFIPMFELAGEMDLNHADSSQNSLLGSIGFRLDLQSIGDAQPSLGLGFVFPMDNASRADVHWGIATSLTLDF
jgi:hypothetical protein